MKVFIIVWKKGIGKKSISLLFEKKEEAENHIINMCEITGTKYQNDNYEICEFSTEGKA